MPSSTRLSSRVPFNAPQYRGRGPGKLTSMALWDILGRLAVAPIVQSRGDTNQGAHIIIQRILDLTITTSKGAITKMFPSHSFRPNLLQRTDIARTSHYVEASPNSTRTKLAAWQLVFQSRASLVGFLATKFWEFPGMLPHGSDAPYFTQHPRPIRSAFQRKYRSRQEGQGSLAVGCSER